MIYTHIEIKSYIISNFLQHCQHSCGSCSCVVRLNFTHWSRAKTIKQKNQKSKTSRQVHTCTHTDTHIQGYVCFRGCGLIGQQSLLVTSTVVSGSASGKAHPMLHPLTADSRPDTVASTHTHTPHTCTRTGQYSCSANLQPAGAGRYEWCTYWEVYVTFMHSSTA